MTDPARFHHPRRGTGPERPEPTGEGGAGPGLLVLEEDVSRAPPAHLAYRCRPAGQVGVTVALVAQPQVAEVGGGDQGGLSACGGRAAEWSLVVGEEAVDHGKRAKGVEEVAHASAEDEPRLDSRPRSAR